MPSAQYINKALKAFLANDPIPEDHTVVTTTQTQDDRSGGSGTGGGAVGKADDD